MKISKSQHAALAILAKGGTCHKTFSGGNSYLRCFDTTGGRLMVTSPTMDKLQGQGLISVKQGDMGTGGYEYLITQKGRTLLAELGDVPAPAPLVEVTLFAADHKDGRVVVSEAVATETARQYKITSGDTAPFGYRTHISKDEPGLCLSREAALSQLLKELERNANAWQERADDARKGAERVRAAIEGIEA
jgi:DNA-binding PadR family transcriptional regulator